MARFLTTEKVQSDAPYSRGRANGIRVSVGLNLIELEWKFGSIPFRLIQ